ncbi:cell wall hydrolase [Echinicola strongylocentroti]|uniref:Cell wall hydrolase n=1 Tax=Echinicola strongylocentroti TaxID=1795355 RepID=A0A2Z4IK70_9BACT|nr:SH3 domain-containing C40 family peptidase [Echinicola strongylocentroti]AWW31521.1 cell wall hydrolase [Echinicola strongylocentroti]
MQNENLTEWPIEHQYGVCRMSLVSVYLAPGPGAGLLTQLLFGETYEVLGITSDEKWLKINTAKGVTSGWMLRAQHHSISEDDFYYYNHEDYQVVISPISTVKYKGELIHILAGSHVHIGSSELFDMGGVMEFTGASRHVKEKASRDELVSLAKLFIHVPFLSGGRGFFGIGAGSFIQLAYKMAGYKAPRYISKLVETGKNVEPRKIQLGDIVIFGNNKDIPHHAGIYVGESQVIHVWGLVRIDNIKLDGSIMVRNNSPLYRVLDIRSLL